MSSGNGQGNLPVQVAPEEFVPPRAVIPRRKMPLPYNSARSLAIAIALFLVTIVSTLAVGAQFALAYAKGQMPSLDDFFTSYVQLLREPRALAAGLPFAVTLMGILLAHELGHFFMCRRYGILATYPYFVPAPTLIGTFGAFIRIRSPIINRNALFDVGISGPIAGFVLAVPAMAIAIAHSKIVPGINASGVPLVFGVPLLQRFLVSLLRPGVSAADLLLHPVARAAWVGLFATSLNLLPGGQLDGGHILYSFASESHRRVTFGVAIALVPLAFFWWGWLLWSVLLIALGFRHPPLMDRWEPLDAKRRIWAAAGLAMFVLCFMPVPLVVTG
jgi:membrane-associated protease RseP (regulator of RpoE activity)